MNSIKMYIQGIGDTEVSFDYHAAESPSFFDPGAMADVEIVDIKQGKKSIYTGNITREEYQNILAEVEDQRSDLCENYY